MSEIKFYTVPANTITEVQGVMESWGVQCVLPASPLQIAEYPEMWGGGGYDRQSRHIWIKSVEDQEIVWREIARFLGATDAQANLVYFTKYWEDNGNSQLVLKWLIYHLSVREMIPMFGKVVGMLPNRLTVKAVNFFIH